MIKPIPPEKITVDLLIKCGIAPTQARAFEKPLQYACAKFNINNLNRFAAFIAQCAVESVNFTQLEENLYYTDPKRLMSIYPNRVGEAAARGLIRNPKGLANRVYSNRLGNSDEASGEGWRYRGRGIIQLTGKENYTQAAQMNQRPYVENPDLVSQPFDAALTAAWFWSARGCNEAADQLNIQKITRIINGAGMLGHNQRLARYEAIKAILQDIF